MKNHISKYVIVLCSIFYLSFVSCKDSSTEPEKQMVDSGSWYETGFTPWPHDGNPYENENFVIYSDAASLEARKWLSQICEGALATIVARLGITDLSILQFPPDRNNKIHIYAYYHYNPMNWGGQAYYGGYLIYSPDHPVRTEWGQTAPENYVPLVKHEMMHVVQTLIIGANDERLYSWFAEGIAIEFSDDEFYSEDGFYLRIDNQAEFDSLISIYGEQNPVSFHHSWEIPTNPEGIGKFYFYPMFWLALRYMTDPAGQGANFHDVRDVLIDAANNVPFGTSLGNRFGINQATFEAQFFELMNNYLN
jgi:hypothetical protein